MYETLKEMLDQMLDTVGSVEFSTHPEVLFRLELQKELATIALSQASDEILIEPEMVDAVTEHVVVSIGAGADLDEVKDLAQRFARVVAKLLGNPSFQALPPVIRRAALRGFTFTYDT